MPVDAAFSFCGLIRCRLDNAGFSAMISMGGIGPVGQSTILISQGLFASCRGHQLNQYLETCVSLCIWSTGMKPGTIPIPLFCLVCNWSRLDCGSLNGCTPIKPILVMRGRDIGSDTICLTSASKGPKYGYLLREGLLGIGRH